MASRVSNVLNVIGRNIKNPGSVIYHAADGVGPNGAYDKHKRHKIRFALTKMRLRPSGRSDDILGNKEGGGSLDNRHEQEQ